MTNLEYIKSKGEEMDKNGVLFFPKIITNVIACDTFFANLGYLSNDNAFDDFTKWKKANPKEYEKIYEAYRKYYGSIVEFCWNKEKNW